jgi:hypothetical protein
VSSLPGGTNVGGRSFFSHAFMRFAVRNSHEKSFSAVNKDKDLVRKNLGINAEEFEPPSSNDSS